MKKPTIKCNSCNGTGHATLPKPYVETLEAWGTHKLRSCADLRATLVEQGKLSLDKPEALDTIVHKRVHRMENWGVVRRVKQVTPRRAVRGTTDIRHHKAWVFEKV